MEKEELIKRVNENISPIKEGFLKFDELKDLCKEITSFIESHSKTNPLWQLRLRKFISDYDGGTIHTEWGDFVSKHRTQDAKSGWDHFEPFYDFFFRFIQEGKIVQRLEENNLWIESRSESKTTHLFIGDRSGAKTKVHLIMDESGQVRFDKNDLGPGHLLDRIESILTTKDGKKIKSIYEFENN